MSLVGAVVPGRARVRVLGGITKAVALLVAILSSPTTASATQRATNAFGPNARVDYQLGGAYPPALGVTIVTRDRTEPSAGRFDICYINGFQAQTNERAWWERHHPSLLLRDENNDTVVDPNWDEAILDISTLSKRRQLTTIVDRWVKGCAKAGYEAVEFDNLDTYTRFPEQLSEANAVDMATRLIGAAKRVGLQVGQKNAVELLNMNLRFDFAVTESCAFYEECEPYLTAFGERVIMIEYDRSAFTKSCRARPGRIILLADRYLAREGAPGHQRSYC